MVPETPTTEVAFAETTLPSACLVCGGDVELKVTGNIARSYCRTCHWVARPELSLTFDGLKVRFKPVGHA